MQIHRNQRGNIDPLLIPLVVSVVLVVGLAGFGIWSYLQFSDQRDNTDQKIAAAVSEAEVVQKEVLEADFAERAKAPFDTWVSATSIGSIELTYPRLWSGYVDEKDRGSKPLNGFFHPNVVSADADTRYALRILVDESNYAKVVATYDKAIEKKTVKSKPFTVNGVSGVKVDGQIDKDYEGSIVILPLRDKTVRIWTESKTYLSDFEKIVLANLALEK